nr:hypothetical protein [Amycolatopsis sp.]
MDVVDNVPVGELLGGVVVTVENYLPGTRRSGTLCQSLRAAKQCGGPDTPLHLGEASRFARHDNVSQQSQFKTGCEAVPLNGYHRALRRRRGS